MAYQISQEEICLLQKQTPYIQEIADTSVAVGALSVIKEPRNDHKSSPIQSRKKMIRR